MTPTWTNMMPSFTGATQVTSTVNPLTLANVGWTIDGSGNIHYYDSSASSWVQHANPTSSAVTYIAGCPDGSLIAVDGSGTFLLGSSGSWSQLFISSHATSSATIGDINNIAIVDTSNVVTKSVYTINTLLASGPTKVSATAGLADIWGTTSTNAVNKWNTTTAAWDSVSGKTLIQLHASKSSTGALQIIGVDTLGKAWSYNGTTWTSIIVPNPGDKFAWIEAGAGYIWAVLQTGAIYSGYI